MSENVWRCQGQALLQQLENTCLPDSMLAVWRLGQCGVALKHEKCLAFIDPVLNDIASGGKTRRNYPPPFAPELARPDYVLCTHGHLDHLAGPTLKAIHDACPKTRFLIPSGCRKSALACGLEEERLILLKPEDRLTLPELTVTALSAAHPEHILDAENPDMALCCCLEFGGIKVLHLGDTYLTGQLFSALEALGEPDLFFPPINGQDYFRTARNIIGNLDAEEAAVLAVRLGAKLSVPTHYDMIQGNTADPLRFAARLRSLDATAAWHIPALGERIIYAKE